MSAEASPPTDAEQAGGSVVDQPAGAEAPAGYDDPYYMDPDGLSPARLSAEARRSFAELLREDPNRVEFFQAVRLLERILPDREPVGRFGDPAREVARFSVPPSISFPASEIQSLEQAGDRQARIGVNFIGLTGPLGVLPYSYTLAIAERVRQRDTAARDFLDLFHHRIASLFYRAWERYRFTVAHERSRRDPLAVHLGDLIGMGTPGLQQRLEVKDTSLHFYSGLLSMHRRSAVGLEQLLADYFGVATSVEQFVGGWYPLPPPDQCELNHEGGTESSQLGFGAVVGDEAWDPQARIRVRLGPLTRAQYDDFLPGGSALPRLRELVRQYTDDQVDVELQLVLARDEVPQCVLGEPGPGAGGGEQQDGGSRLPLGWATWLRTTPSTHDRDDTVMVL